MKTDLIKTFNSSDRPVVITNEQRDIIFYNALAKEIFPSIGSTRGDKLFHPDFFMYDMEHFVGCSVINDVQTSVNVYVSGHQRAFVLYYPDTKPLAEARNLLTAIGANMAASISTLRLATNLVLKNLESSGDEKLHRYSEIITHNCYKMNRMANNIASVSDSAIASPFSSSLNDESYLDIAKMCSSVAGDTNHLLADMAADIEYVGSTEPLLFYGYSSPLERMLLNLLSNSIKYTEKEGKISIELKAEEKYITITVSDNGQGMEENILHDVWNRYAYPTDRLDYKTGTGLGLSVVFRSVRQHKGSAVISSKKGHGTSTIVKLPRRMPNDIMLRDSVTPYLTKGMHPLLVELSDVIEYCRYSNHYLD